jgi:hypothetical protein
LVNRVKNTIDKASRHVSFVDTEMNLRFHKRQETSWLLSSELASKSTSMHLKMVMHHSYRTADIMTRCKQFDSQQGQSFIYWKSKPNLGPTQPPIKCIP